MTGEVLGSRLCRRASPPSEALWSQPAACQLGSTGLREPGPRGAGQGLRCLPSACRTTAAGSCCRHFLGTQCRHTPAVPACSRCSEGHLPWPLRWPSSSHALCLARVFDRAFFTPSKTGVYSLLHCAALKLFSCGLLSHSAGPICFL